MTASTPPSPRIHLDPAPEESLILTLLDVANHLTRKAEELAQRAGLTAQQWLVLLQVAGDPNFGGDGERLVNGRVLASDIAAARGVSRAHISALVASLLKKGMIRQTQDVADRRRKWLEITESGASALESIEGIRRTSNRQLFDSTGEAKVNEVLGTLEDLRSTLADQRENQRRRNGSP
jgi:MarR family transcriptional regulator, transcriptional regulator for hemolysin